jgi:signal transduction histidine kinase
LVEVQDRGSGIPAAKLKELERGGSGVGIRGMRERVRQFQGTLKLESDNSGTRVSAIIPVPRNYLDEEHNGAEPLKTAV